MDIGKVLEKTLLAFYRDKQLFAIALIQAVILTIFSYLIANYIIIGMTALLIQVKSGNAGVAASAAWYLISFIAFIVVLVLVELLFYCAILAKVFYGKRIGIVKAFSNGINRYLSALALIAFVVLVYFVALLAIILLSEVSAILLILLIPFAIYAIYSLVKISMALPFTVLGKYGPIESLKRSWNAATHNWWGIFFTLLVIATIVYIIEDVISIPIVLQTLAGHKTLPNQASALNATNVTTNSTKQNIALSNALNTIGILSSAVGSSLFLAITFISYIIRLWLIIALGFIYIELAPNKAAMNKRNQ
ncbi:MAG: hypothetical protein QXF01_02200 [Candidatus Micrarchaeaceae archaeon]